MLKKRIIAAIFVKNDIVVQSMNFKKYLPVGKPEIAAEAFCNWGADEIFLIDISATLENKSVSMCMVEKVAAKCTVPLTVGGGVRCVETIGSLFEVGADKVCMNASILDNQCCLNDGKNKFGRQSMVASIDFVTIENNQFVFDYRSRKATNKTLIAAVNEYIDRGCGELLINDVKKDGTQVGFDIDLISEVTDASAVPVIWAGGAGRPDDFVQAFRSGDLSGVAAANIFHFCEHSLSIVKAHVSKSYEVRQDMEISYIDMPITDEGRISKLPDLVLENLVYEKLQKEFI